MSTRIAVFCVFLIALPAVSGCTGEEEVITRSVKRTEEPRRPMNVDAMKKLLSHILVAIVPMDDKAWFFKISGPADNVEAVKEDFAKFIGTLKTASEKSSPPAWELPEGWQQTGPSGMRAATIKIPREKGEVEIAVSSLPMVQEWDDFLYVNVERWMRQVGEDPLSIESINKIAQKVETKAGTATILHLAGRTPPQGRPNPHAGMAMNPPAKKPAQPDASKTAGAAAPANPFFDYKMPKGWQPGKMKPMRKAAYDVTDGKLKAEVTVSSFSTSAGPMITDPAANVRRWAGEVGIREIDTENVEGLSQPIKIDGLEGRFFELLGPLADDQPLATLVVMVTRDDQVWFFKLKGDQKLVQQQQKSFRAFLDSVSFK